MQMMLRDRDYGDLLPSLKGKRVLIWTCNTCARLCGVGGSAEAERLAEKLRSDGVDVPAVMATGASCIASNLRKCENDVPDGCDIVLSLTCDIGAKVAGDVFGIPVLNPVRTFGTGYRDDDRRCWIMDRDGNPDTELGEVGRRVGLAPGPFVRAPPPL